MRLPLEKRLKRRIHVEVAALQDLMVEIVYKLDERAVLHGGTAIWRCFGSNRFSEDLDFYLSTHKDLKNSFVNECKKYGIEPKKFKKTTNIVFAKVAFGNAEVRVEGNFKVKKDAFLASYERIDSSAMPVYTLRPEELLMEKINAYLSRAFIRDFYDVYFLLDSGKVSYKEVKRKLREFLKDAPEPRDEKALKAIVYSGAVPTFKMMKQKLRRFCI